MIALKPPCTNSRAEQIQLLNNANKQAALIPSLKNMIKAHSKQELITYKNMCEDVSATYDAIFFCAPHTDIAKHVLNQFLYYDLIMSLLDYTLVNGRDFADTISKHLSEYTISYTQQSMHAFINGEGLKYNIKIKNIGTFYCDGTSGIDFEYMDKHVINIITR